MLRCRSFWNTSLSFFFCKKTKHLLLRRVPHKSGTSIFERLARVFCVYSCCVLCVKYARVQNKSARSRQCRISRSFFQFRTQITAKKSCRSKLFVFPMKNGTRIYIQMIPWLSFGWCKTANYETFKVLPFSHTNHCEGTERVRRIRVPHTKWSKTVNSDSSRGFIRVGQTYD